MNEGILWWRKFYVQQLNELVAEIESERPSRYRMRSTENAMTHAEDVMLWLGKGQRGRERNLVWINRARRAHSLDGLRPIAGIPKLAKQSYGCSR